jgi:hypothetical protein
LAADTIPATASPGEVTRRRFPARARRDFVLLGFIGIGVMAAYLAVQRGEIESFDGKAMASVAQNLLLHHSVKECCNGFGAFPRDPGPYAKEGIGYSLVLAPLWHFQLTRGNPQGATWLGLANPFLLTVTTIVIAKTGLVLGWRRSSAALAALAFALLTMAPIYSAEFFAEPGVTLGTALVILGFAVWQQRVGAGALLVGLGIALAALFRPDSIVLLGLTVPLLALFHSRAVLIAKVRWWLPCLAFPIGLTLAWTLHYNSLRYGNPFQLGYSGAYDFRGFSTPLVQGVALLLWSPGKSLFVYSPILLAAIPGFALLWRRRRSFAIVIAVVFVSRVLLYARWWTPEGGNSWGPRFLLPLCAVLAIPLGEAFEHLHRMRSRTRRNAIAGLGVLAAMSAVVQFSSLMVSYRDVFPGLYDLKGLPTPIARTIFHHRMHRFLWSFGGNHISWNLGHIGSKEVHSPLYWFHGGPTAFGLGMLALAAVMCAGAIGLAMLSDRIEDRRA